MLPALVGAIIGTVYTDISLMNLLTFSLTLYYSFCTGLSFSYYISSFYRISLTRTITSAIIFIISYSLIFYNYEITGSLEWYLNGQIGRQANYKIGIMNGELKTWYPNGIVKATYPIVSGKIEGTAKYYDSDGNLSWQVYSGNRPDSENCLDGKPEKIPAGIS